MKFSRQFKAVGRIAFGFAGTWAVTGAVIAILTAASAPDRGLLNWVVTHMFMFGALGAISGLVTAILVARVESGRQVAQLATHRFVVWGVVGGLAPVTLFAVLGAVFGASPEALMALMALAVVSAGLGGVVAASAAAMAKRGELAAPEAVSRLRAP